MSKKKAKIWVTKYALTTGVYATIAELDTEHPRMAVEDGRGLTLTHYYHKPHWWLTEAEARARFKLVRDAAKKRLVLQLKKVSDLHFKVGDRCQQPE